MKQFFLHFSGVYEYYTHLLHNLNINFLTQRSDSGGVATHRTT